MNTSREHTLSALERRLPADFIRERRALERSHDRHIFRLLHRFMHVDGPISLHACVRTALRLSLLYGRGLRNATRIQLRENELRFPDLPAAFDGFTILQVTDLHADGNADAMDALERMLGDLDYDHCVLTGDYRSLSWGPTDTVLARMKTIAARLKGPVHGVLGNHDSIDMLPALEAMGIAMLVNESVAITRGDATIHLCGIDDPHYFGTHDFAAARAGVPEDAVAILLAHSPECYAGAEAAGFDAMLCGHTHGGQICLPGGLPVILQTPGMPRRFGRGLWRHGRMTGFTSHGAGTSMVHVRFNCPGEVVLHRLRRG